MFEGQHPDEKIIFIIDRQAAVLFRPTLYLTLALFVPIFTFVLYKFSAIFYYALFAWLVLGGLYLFRTWYCYKNSKYFLTTKRLISQNQKGLFYRNVSETPLEKIQDVSVEVKGLWPSIWHYGTIYAQTAGTAERFALHYVEEPNKIKDQIVEAMHGIGGKGSKEEEEEEGEKGKVKKRKFSDIKKRPKKENDFWE